MKECAIKEFMKKERDSSGKHLAYHCGERIADYIRGYSCALQYCTLDIGSIKAF